MKMRFKSTQITKAGVSLVLLTSLIISLSGWAQGPADLSVAIGAAELAAPSINANLSATSANLQAQSAAAVTSRNGMNRTHTARTGQAQVYSHYNHPAAMSAYASVLADRRGAVSYAASRFPRALPNVRKMETTGTGEVAPGSFTGSESSRAMRPIGLLTLGPAALNSSSPSRMSSLLSLSNQQRTGSGFSAAGRGLGAGLGQGLSSEANSSASGLFPGTAAGTDAETSAARHFIHGRPLSGSSGATPGSRQRHSVPHGPSSSRFGHSTRDQMDNDSLGLLLESLRAGTASH